ncbi:MAG: hypothetical protein H6838_13360 [Planctomycetes bacterium]|nr:hypothetical protein [Planctomycetota bacterium]MCB9886478.1 hypothetical protein [Planctomycetota bacterium]
MNHDIFRLAFAAIAPAAALTAQILPPAPIMLRDITPGGGNGPQFLTVFQGRVWFAANDQQVGDEMWVTDGTPQGTQLFLDLLPGSAGSYPTDYCVLGDRMFFGARGSGAGQELWVTNGTVAGTQLFADLNPGVIGSDPKHLTRIGNEIYFSADAGGGPEPWVTDGTVAGTRSLGDFRPGTGGSYPEHFTGYPGQVVFSAIPDPMLGRELCITDGTIAGTQLLKDINPGVYYGVPQRPMVAWGGHVYFAANDGVNGQEIWRTDFTAAGTVLFNDFLPGAGSSQPRDFQRDYLDRGILFTAGRQNTTGDVFWYDGTNWGWFAPGGINIPPPLSSVYPQNVRAIGSRKIYCCASTPNHSLELVVMDHTLALGMAVYDINTAGGSNPRDFTLLGDTVVFVATDATHGPELWALHNGATERPVEQGCSGSRLDVEDPVLGRDIYYRITTDVPNAAPMTMIGWPAQTPFVLPWVSACPVHVDPGLTAFAFYPAGWQSGTIHVPGDVALNGLLLVMQCYVGSATVPSAYDFTNPVYLHLGL